MDIEENKKLQQDRLQRLCEKEGIEFDLMNDLLDSVKVCKLSKNNYHQQIITDVIEKEMA